MKKMKGRKRGKDREEKKKYRPRNLSLSDFAILGMSSQADISNYSASFPSPIATMAALHQRTVS
jgi:hypothetical protein